MLTSVPRRLRPLGVDDKSTVLQEADETGTAVIYGVRDAPKGYSPIL